MSSPFLAFAVVLAAGFALLVSTAAASAVVATATTSLTDDAQGRPLFAGGLDLAPGESRSACLTVQGTGAGPRDTVTLQASEVTGDLAGRLGLKVSVGTGSCATFSGAPVYEGTLAGLATRPIDSGWAPGDSDRRVFRFSVTVPIAETEPGAEAGAGFVWRLTTSPVDRPPTPPPATPPTSTTPRPSDTRDVTPSAGPSTPSTPSTPVTPTNRSTRPSDGPTSVPATDVPSATEPSGRPNRPASPSTARSADAVPGETGSGRTPPSGGPATPDPASDVQLHASTPRKIAQTLAAVATEKSPLLVWPLVAAGLFMLVQHRIDRYDPKLAQASRTQRDLTVIFPVQYDGPGAQP